jgi:hypothetical protein
MGFKDQVAQQEFPAVHVRFGSSTDIPACPTHVRCTLNSGLKADIQLFPFGAINRRRAMPIFVFSNCNRHSTFE